jgi:glycosyltransferase involved in cell wall biosynthesis
LDIAMISTPSVRVPPQGYGGTELVVEALVAGLAARGHRITFVGTGDAEVPARVRSLYAHAAWPPDPWRELAHTCFALRELSREGPFDVIHAHVPAATAFAGSWPAPLVLTVHHGPEAAIGELYRAASPRRFTPVALTRRHAETLGRDLWGQGPVVIGHGLPPWRYPLGPGGPAAVFLGRWAREKGPHVAIDAARGAGVTLRLAGRVHPQDLSWWREAGVPRLGGSGLEVIGEVEHARKVALLAEACAMLFPIDWEEPFGLVLVESMLCGTPVIAFPRGSVPELVDEGVTGFVVRDEEEMADRLRWLSRTGFDRGRCRAQAVRRFSAGVMTDRYERLYQHVSAARVRVRAEST